MEEYRVNNQMEEVLDKELEALMESMPDYGRLEKRSNAASNEK